MTGFTPSPSPDVSGAMAIELAIILPIFALCVFGLIEFSRLVWTQGTLNYAVQSASRCGAIDKNNCGINAQIQAWAAASAYGLSADPSQFVVDTTQPCGVNVSISMPFEFIVPAITETLTGPITLNAGGHAGLPWPRSAGQLK